MKLTLLLILINVSVFILSLANFEYFITNYGFNINNFLAGNYHTLITSLFLHGDFIHLLSNMVALLFLGRAAESSVKAWQYLLVYFLAGIFGNLLMFFPIFGYSKEVIAIGASAAISGLIGLGIFVCPGRLVLFGSLIPMPFIVAGALYLVLTFSQLFVISEIAYPAHLGGMFVGAMFGFVLGENIAKRLILFILICLLIILLPYLIGFVLA